MDHSNQGYCLISRLSQAEKRISKLEDTTFRTIQRRKKMKKSEERLYGQQDTILKNYTLLESQKEKRGKKEQKAYIKKEQLRVSIKY